MEGGSEKPSGAVPRAFVVLLISLVLVLSACTDQEISSEESAKADQLVSELAASGVEMSPAVAAALYGTDGGRICAAEGPEGYHDVILVQHRFALRKTVVSPRDVAVATAVVDVYCPDRSGDLAAFVDGLEQGETSDDA